MAERIISNEGDQLITNWNNARKWLAKAQEERARAETALAQAEAALGKWLAPEDAISGERFQIPIGSTFLCVEKAVEDQYRVWWRNGVAARDQH